MSSTTFRALEPAERQDMLHDFITANRAEIIVRSTTRIARSPTSAASDVTLEQGVPLFLDQLVDTLRLALARNPAIAEAAALYGNALLHGGFTIAQVVNAYGGMCQTITELAGECEAPITTREFQTLNLCLDNAIAAAVTEYGRLREHEGTERLGRLAHELRNQLNGAVLAFDMLKQGSVGVGGSTGAVLTRSLTGLGKLIDRELATVRLDAEVHHFEPVVVRELIEDLEIAATMEAGSRGVQFVVASIEQGVAVQADRQVMSSVVANLLQNAFKFTRPCGHVLLRVRATSDRVFIDVEDECGGLPADKAQLFRPFQQRGLDRTGLGLGLDICARGARVNGGQIHVANHPGTGCVFTLDLPRLATPSPARGEAHAM